MQLIKDKIFIVISVAIIVGFTLGYIILKKNGQEDYEIYKIDYGNVYQEIVETGSVRPAKTVDLAFRIQAKVAAILIEAGDRVRNGQPLVSLEQEELRLQVLEAEAALEIAQAKLDKILSGASREDIQVYETAVINAEVSLENKNQALADTLSEAENDLLEDYGDLADILTDAYLKADDAIHQQIDELFIDDDTVNPRLTFTTADSQAKHDVEWQRVTTGGELDELKKEITDLNLKDYDQKDQVLLSAKNRLIAIRNFLDQVSKALNGAINLSSSDLSTYKTNLNTARTNINTALTNITTQQQAVAATKITNQTNINVAQTAVDAAKASLKSAQDELAFKKADPQTADVSLAKAQVKQAQAVLDLNREKLSQTILKSPIDGVVTGVEIEIGETTTIGHPVISVENRNKFQIEVDIYEEDIPKVKLGDLVEIELVAFQNEELNGRVVFIDPSEKIIDGVVYYEARIDFEKEKEGLKAGMTADLIIKTDFRENVLVVPREAVYKVGSKSTVEIFANDIIEEREIKTGLEGNNGFYEIITGLQKGDAVVIR